MEAIILINKYKYYIFAFINLLWIYALLSPNIYYFDDNYRASGGYYNWGGDFRPFADWLYYILGLGRRFTDLTPLPQIFALIFLYLTYFLYLKKFGDENIKVSTLLVFIPIVWNPFLLSNLYFRYDSIFMLLAMLLSVLAVFEIDTKKYLRATLLLFIACGFYQPAIVGYVCTALFFVYKIKEDNKEEIFKIWLKQSALYLLIFFLAILFYYFLIMKLTVDYNFYSATHSQIAIKNAVPNILQALKEISIIFQSDTGAIFLALFIFLLLINLYYLVAKLSYLGVVVFLIIQGGFIVSAAGVNLFLDVPRFEYRTFMFYGFYMSYLLLGMMYITELNKYRKYIIFILFFIVFYFLSIALSTSNAQKYKNKFDDSLILDIVGVLYGDGNFNSVKTIIFYGETIPYTVQQLVYKYPIIGGIATNASYYTYKIQNYFPYQLKYIKFRLEQDKVKYINYMKSKDDFSILKDTQFYTIYNSSQETIIEFKSLESQ